MITSAVAFVIALASDPSDGVPTPEEHLGRPVGMDFELADWGEVSSYFRALGAASPNVLTEVVGTTTEGRDFLLATITSEENHARIDELKAMAARIADPRGLEQAERDELIANAKPVLFISCAMHATETAAPQFAMELAHRLATSDEETYAGAREELVVLLAPSLNPDGQDHVVSWYRETVGTPYEASELLKLYQYYTGHDNNRDWFGLTQNETRIVTNLLYSVWHPQVYWDVHQQGTRRERFFVPPFRDPLDPNLDPGVIAGIGALGYRALFDMTRDGFSGISTGVTYDMWWNGGNRNVPVRHNIIGLLTEAASVNIASPIFLRRRDLSAPRGLDGYAPSNRFPDPWPGGWWRLRDIIDYEHAFARSLLESLAWEPETWTSGALEAAERALERGAQESPRAWIVPSTNRDLAACERLADMLLIGGVELFVAREEFHADGRAWPAGSLVIPMEQPYGGHVKDLFEIQRYPDGPPPYDVSGWTLPILLGVRRVEVRGELEVAMDPIESAGDVRSAFEGAVDRAAGDASTGDAWMAAIAAAAEGQEQWLVDGAFTTDAPDSLVAAGQLTASPRIGLYAPWRGTMNEGWMRWVLDAFGVPYVRVRNEMLRAGELDEFLDVLVMPNIRPRSIDGGRSEGSAPSEYLGGLAPEGAVAIEEFVRDGGKLVAMEGSARWAIELFDLPIEDAARVDGGDFSCPGSVVRTIPADHRLMSGVPANQAVFFSSASAWRIEGGGDADEKERAKTIEVLLNYAPSRLLTSGWIREPERIAGLPAWVTVPHGDGNVHLFGFRPQYRGWSQQAFPLLFRAIYLD